MITRFISILAGTLSLVLYVACLLLGVLDTLQMTPVWAKAVSIPTVVLLLVGLIGLHLVVERLTLLRELNRRSEALTRSATSLESMVATMAVEVRNQDAYTQRTNVLNSRHVKFAELLTLIASVPSGTRVDVTHFEKVRATHYFDGESDIERKFMEVWESRVRAGELTVRHIVHISSQQDLTEIEDRLRRFSECAQYSLAVVVGPPMFPYMDFMCVHHHCVVIDLPEEVQDPGRAACALFIRNNGAVDAFRLAFNVWWRQSDVLKQGANTNWSNVERLAHLLTANDPVAGGKEASELAFVIERLPVLNSITSMLKECCSRLATPEMLETVGQALKGPQERFVSEIRSILESAFTVRRGHVNRVLEEIVGAARAQLDAASHATRQMDFWNSDAGKAYQKRNCDAAKRVKIRRVFILSEADMKDSDTHRMLDAQASSGIEVYLAREADIAEDFRGDYLICDDRLVFVFHEREKSAEIGGTLNVNDKSITSYRRRFDSLLSYAKRYNGG